MSRWNELQDLSKRMNEADMLAIRDYRVNNYGGWKARIEKVDKLYRGEWDTIMPDESAEKLEPMVTNLVQIGLDDLKNLVAESMPSMRVYPNDDTDKAVKEAYKYEAVGETYWEANRGEDVIPDLALDLAGTGACFVYVDISDKDAEYPQYRRLDPRFVYPKVVHGKLDDIFVAQQIRLSDAVAAFPALREHLPEKAKRDTTVVEIWEYYSKDVCIQGFALLKNDKVIENSPKFLKTWEPGIGRCPVAFARTKSFDGEFRGIFDQIDTSIKTKNRIVQLLLDYSDQLTYAPMVSKGLLNDQDAPGPQTHYRLDPNTPDAQVGRVAPAGSSPQLYALIDFLEREQRSGVAYPAARQGEVQQSIASASFVNSTLGQLTSTVRGLQRSLGFLREDLFDISAKLDQKWLPGRKPLFRAIGKVRTYDPAGFDFPIHVKVVYGAGAGLDRMNADTRILQHLGANLISRQTARENIDYIAQDGEEEDRIEKEQAENIAIQKFLQEAPWQEVGKVTKLMGEQGLGLMEAIAIVAEQAPPAEAAAPPGGAPPAPPEGMAPPGSEQMALQHGGMPGGDAEMMGGIPTTPAPPPDLGGIKPPGR